MSTCLNEEILLEKKREKNNKNDKNKKESPTCKAKQQKKYRNEKILGTREIFQSDRVVESFSVKNVHFLSCLFKTNSTVFPILKKDTK